MKEREWESITLRGRGRGIGGERQEGRGWRDERWREWEGRSKKRGEKDDAEKMRTDQRHERYENERRGGRKIMGRGGGEKQGNT